MIDHKLAEALRGYIEDYKSEDGMFDAKHYVRQFQEALAAHEAEQQAGEAVAWASIMGGKVMTTTHDKVLAEQWKAMGGDVRPLFTPPQQPLTNLQIDAIWLEKPRWHAPPIGQTDIEFARAIERAHGIGITKDTK